VERQAAFLAGHELAGVFVAGTTGECHSLTVEERIQLLRRWAQVARGTTLRVLAHVGHNCQADACRLAKAAAAAGAHGIAAMAPFFFKPDLSALLDFLAPVAAAAGDLPFYYYDIPHMTGVVLQTPRLLEEARRRIPQFAGVKYTNPDLVQMQACVQLDGGAFQVLHGFDETLLAGVVLGASGAIGTTYNFAPQLYQRMLRSIAAGDVAAARREQARAMMLVQRIAEFGFGAASKAVMLGVGIDCGPPRPPLPALTPEQTQALLRQVEELQVL
jgi:N-acetylneuraminate lyase